MWSNRIFALAFSQYGAPVFSTPYNMDHYFYVTHGVFFIVIRLWIGHLVQVQILSNLRRVENILFSTRNATVMILDVKRNDL
jgi:hypothetical protein